jgi:hypothetical protein
MGKEYIIFCDESDTRGKYYSNFYGGVLISSSRYEEVSVLLENKKEELNFKGEVKWQKVTDQYLDKYTKLMSYFFDFLHRGDLKVRIMFRHNVTEPQGLSDYHRENEYFLLYYQFIKHAFNLKSMKSPEEKRIRIYFDQFPHTKDKIESFRSHLYKLASCERDFIKNRIIFHKEDLTEVKSHEHVLLQCLDVVLGAMCFKLNNKHKEIPEGKKRRGKRTIAKEKLYKHIYGELIKFREKFNIGESTGGSRDWEIPYRHWKFIPNGCKYNWDKAKP